MTAYDSQVMVGGLERAGWEAVPDPEQADLVLVNTCAVREHAERRALGRLSQLAGLRRRRAAPLILGVAGCMAQRLGADLIAATGGRVDLVVGPDQYDRLPELAAEAAARGEALVCTEPDHGAVYRAKPRTAPPGGSHFVAVMRGCDNYCAYCVVPYTRGRERSKPWRQVADEVADLAARGAFEVVLLGQSVSNYHDGDVDLAGLLERLHDIPGLQSLRFLTSYPTDASERLLRTVAALPKVGTELHLPFQAGSDRILAAMNRRYTVAGYEAVLDRARAIVPDALFTTDIIVGFPGETEADFAGTLAVVERQGFASAFTFKYSTRAGTRAARLPDDVPLAAKEERLARLNALQSRKTRELLESQLGRTLEIVLDEPSKKRETQLRGRSRNNLRVFVDRAPGLSLGARVRARVNAIAGTSLIGTLAGEA
jgi:tRNA-2-methylthio-N6-dimethylallyladenosine synthase